MSEILDDLIKDCPRLLGSLKSSSVDPAMVRWVEHNLIPYLGQLVGEVAEIDTAVQEHIDEAPELIYTDTAAILSLPITLAMELLALLSPTIQKDSPTAAKVVAFGTAAQEALAKLEDIVVYDQDADQDDDDDQEGDE